MTWKQAGRDQALDSTGGLASLIFPASVAVMIPFLSPVIVGGLVDAAGWTERQAGLLVSVEMGAFAWSGVAGVLWLNRLPWRVVSLAACALLLAANLASCFVISESMLMAWRTVSGIGAGTLIALCYGALARTRKPHRNYAIFSMNQMALAMVCLAFLPVAINGSEGNPDSMAAVVLGALGVTRALGMNAFFVTMLVLGLLGTGCAALWTPVRPEKPLAPRGDGAGRTNWLLAIAMLVAIFALMVSQQGLWTYAERMGVSAGITRSSVAGVLTLGALAGLVGASTASAVGDRFSRPLVIAVVVALHLGALSAFLFELTAFTFLLGILLHKFTWNFMIPYQLGMMALVERGGTAAILSTFITSTGVSAGSAIAAFLVTDFSYRGIILESMLFAMVYMGIMLGVNARLQSASVKNDSCRRASRSTNGQDSEDHRESIVPLSGQDPDFRMRPGPYV